MNLNRSASVLFVTRRFPPSVGGMERFAYDLSKVLGQKTKLHLIKWSGKNKYIHVLLIPVFFIRASWVLLTQNVDVIHMQDGVLSILGAILKLIFRKPLTVVIHGLDVTHNSKLYQFLVTKSLKKADHIFCISHMAMNEVTKRDIPASKVSFIPLGVTDDIYTGDKSAVRKRINQKFNVSPSSQIILSTGRLVKRKGLNWFIANVMPNLVKQNPKVILLVSGDGPELDAIKSTVQKLKLTNYVKLLGRTSDEDLADLYNGSDLFVMPNIKVAGDMEGFGRVLIEAALCKLPVVASGIEGINDAITDGQNGVLLKSKDMAEFEAAILKFLNNSPKAKEFGKKARDFSLKKFNWDKIADQYISNYEELIR